jgi:DNA-binding transcriptional MerR regulator/predicted transcriptional regulator YdeE
MPLPLMPIGRFARACRLTIKALRYYDEEELLRPASVDPRSGYRYYARDQVRDAILIGMLRELGIGVAAIRRILHAPSEERSMTLQAEARRIERELARRRTALRTLERFVAIGALTPYDVSIRTVEPLVCAHQTITTIAEQLIVDTTALIYGLFDELRAAGREILAPVLCMNDDSISDEHIVVHACVRVEPPAPALSRARTLHLPGGRFACVTHVGAYEELGLAYHALYAWAQEHGHEARGLIREVYHNDPGDTAAEELVTELMMPLG